MFKEKLRIRFSQLTGVAIIAFLVALAVSITSPVFPIFAEKVSGKPELVGLIASVFGLSAIFINLYIARYFEKDGVMRNLKIGILLYASVFASYLFINSTLMLALSQIILAAAVCFSWTALSILVNGSSDKKNLGSSEGEYFTFINLGVMLGIIFGGMVAMSYSYNAVFLYAAAIFFGIFLLSGIIGIKDGHKHHLHKCNIFKESKRFFKNEELKKAFLSNVGLYFWVSVAFLYLPIVLKSFGFDLGQIGLIFAAMIVPYLLIEYPVGKLAEKEGSKKFISLGFFAIALASFLIYENFGAIYSMILFFFLSFMGAAAIEPLNELNLNTHSRKGDLVENMAIFKTSLRIAYFLGPISAAILISLVGIEKMFLVLAVIMAGFWWMVGK